MGLSEPKQKIKREKWILAIQKENMIYAAFRRFEAFVLDSFLSD